MCQVSDVGQEPGTPISSRLWLCHTQLGCLEMPCVKVVNNMSTLSTSCVRAAVHKRHAAWWLAEGRCAVHIPDYDLSALSMACPCHV